MRYLISDYLHHPGEHCGSTALRNLVHYKCGLNLSEAFTFGLGSGIEFIYVRSPLIDPEVLAIGRNAILELDLAENLGLGYSEQMELDSDKAWDDLRSEVLKGNPAVVCTDIFYLDHTDYKYHLPFNRSVVVGFDDDLQKAYLHTRANPELQAVSYDSLRVGRNPKEYPIFNLWGRFNNNQVKRSLEEACVDALRKAAMRFMGQEGAHKDLLSGLVSQTKGEFSTGLDALKTFQSEFQAWRDHEKGEWLLFYLSQVFEKFGNGGGNFRRLYAGFTKEVRELFPHLMQEEIPEKFQASADLWTSLAEGMYNIGKENGSNHWESAENLIGEIMDLESEIFSSILENLPE